MRSKVYSRPPGLAAVCCLTLGVLGLTASANAQTGYSETKLVSDRPGKAEKTDPNLVNPWGLAAVNAGDWWVSDNNSGLTTLYDGEGNIQSLVVTIPPGSSDPTSKGSPTGVVGNTTSDFGGSFFIFDSEDGTISAWFGASSTVTQIDKGTAAVYKGLAMATMGTVNVLYATNFRAGTVEAYDMDFNPFSLAAGAFTDPKIPAGFAPFGIQNIKGNLYVTFAKQDAAKHDQVNGAGLGYVDEFDPTGKLLHRLQHVSNFNAPWGIALAGSNFGTFSGDILVGMFGSGQIAAFDPATSKFVGVVSGSNGKAIAIPGLWALQFGQGGTSGPTDWLYFTAGPQNEAHGLFGFLSPL